MKKGLRLALLVLGAQVCIAALAAGCCADRIACVTVHAYFHVEEPCFGFRELDHY